MDVPAFLSRLEGAKLTLSLCIIPSFRYIMQYVRRFPLFYHRNFIIFVRLNKRGMEFTLTEEYIELIRLLKITRVAESGGQAKVMVENGDVWRNGVQEFRKRAKIRKGEVITVNGTPIHIQ